MDKINGSMTETPKRKTILKKSVLANFRDWNTNELRLLDAYLSKIDVQKSESRKVRFTFEEYATLLGVSSLNCDQIKSSARKLLGKVFTVNHKDKFEIYTIFSSAQCYEEEHRHFIEFNCSDQIKNLFFSMAGDSHVKCQLQSMVHMSKQYSLTLYCLLIDMLRLPTDELMLVGVEELRTKLGVLPETYEEFKIFKRDVLDAAVKEINKVSNLDVEYSCLKSGRRCTSIKFDVAFKNTIDYSIYIPSLTSASANKIGRRIKRLLLWVEPNLTENQVNNIIVNVFSACETELSKKEETSYLKVEKILEGYTNDKNVGDYMEIQRFQSIEE